MWGLSETAHSPKVFAQGKPRMKRPARVCGPRLPWVFGVPVDIWEPTSLNRKWPQLSTSSAQYDGNSREDGGGSCVSSRKQTNFSLNMHYRFLVTFNKEEAVTSAEARAHVDSYLITNNFCGDQTRWGGGQGDWYVIGGRWSGELTEAHLDEAKLEALNKEFGEKYGWETGGEEGAAEELRHEQYRQMFLEVFPEWSGELPGGRNSYQEAGYEDDAMVVDEVLYNGLLKEFEGSVEDDFHADLDYEEVSREFIGRKWIVVVDYHN